MIMISQQMPSLFLPFHTSCVHNRWWSTRRPLAHERVDERSAVGGRRTHQQNVVTSCYFQKQAGGEEAALHRRSLSAAATATWRRRCCNNIAFHHRIPTPEHHQIRHRRVEQNKSNNESAKEEQGELAASLERASERETSSLVARSWGVDKQFTLATHSRSRVLYQQQPTPTRAFRVRTTTPDGRDRSNHKVTWRERAQTSCDMQRNLTRNDVVPRAARSSSSPWRQQQQRQADSGTHTTWGEEEAAAAAAAQEEEVVTTSNDKILLRRCLFCCSCFFFFCWVLFLAPASCRLNRRYRLRYTTVVCGEGLRRSERRTQVHMKKLLLLLLL